MPESIFSEQLFLFCFCAASIKIVFAAYSFHDFFSIIFIAICWFVFHEKIVSLN